MLTGAGAGGSSSATAASQRAARGVRRADALRADAGGEEKSNAAGAWSATRRGLVLWPGEPTCGARSGWRRAVASGGSISSPAGSRSLWTAEKADFDREDEVDLPFYRNKSISTADKGGVGLISKGDFKFA